MSINRRQSQETGSQLGRRELTASFAPSKSESNQSLGAEKIAEKRSLVRRTLPGVVERGLWSALPIAAKESGSLRAESMPQDDSAQREA